MKKIMQGRSRILQAIIFGCGLSMFWALLLPEMVSADALVDSISGKALDQDDNPVFKGMVIKEGDMIKPDIDAVVRVSCGDRTVRTVQAGVFSGLGLICPQPIIYGDTLPDRGGHCSSVSPNVLATAYDRPFSTTAAYPTFLFFVPTTSARQAEFVFKSSDRKVIYRQTFVLAGQSGILRVALPTDGRINELIVGQTYEWEFNIICDRNNSQKDDYVVGGLHRVLILSNPKYQLPPSLRDRLLFYRVNGFNYDGLIMLDALRRDNPTDSEIQTLWESWLERYKLGDLKRLPAITLPSPSQSR